MPYSSIVKSTPITESDAFIWTELDFEWIRKQTKKNNDLSMPKLLRYVHVSSVCLLNCSACKKYDAFQFLVIKKVVERPEATWFTIRIRIKIRIVAVNITLIQNDFIIDCGPKCLTQCRKLIASDGRQIWMNWVHNPLNRWFFTEFMALQCKERMKRDKNKQT